MHAVATGAEAGFMNCIRNTEKGIVIIAKKTRDRTTRGDYKVHAITFRDNCVPV
jgi:hypothetical protein